MALSGAIFALQFFYIFGLALSTSSHKIQQDSFPQLLFGNVKLFFGQLCSPWMNVQSNRTRPKYLNYPSAQVKQRRIQIALLYSNSGISANKCLFFILLLLSNDIQVNPGPTRSPEDRNFQTNMNVGQSDCALEHIKGIKLVHLNIRSLIKNIEELRLFAFENSPDVITLSETWLEESIGNDEIGVANYNIERCDRNRNGGGTLMYIHQRFSYKRLENNINLEIVICKLELLRSRPLLVGSIYRPPQVEDFYSNFIEYLNTLELHDLEMYLLGDFNCRGITSIEKNFIASMSDLGLHQLIKEPTRVTQSSSSIIDLIFTNSLHRTTASGVLKLALSDHYMVYCNRSCKTQRDKPKIFNTRSFKNFDPEKFVSDLSNLPWDIIYTFDTPDDVCFAFDELLRGVCDQHAPLRSMRVKGSYPPWMSDDIIHAIKSRNTAKRKAADTKQDQDWNIYKKLRNRVTRLIELAKRDYTFCCSLTAMQHSFKRKSIVISVNGHSTNKN